MQPNSTKLKGIKSVDVVEITTLVPKEQVNLLRQLILRYLLDNNNEEIAFKLIDHTQTRLREDLQLFENGNGKH